jgi:serine protease Do
VPSNIATKLGIKGWVMITNVRPGSFADEINLTKGAIITEIDTPSSKRAVTDQTAYQSIVSSLKSGDDIAFIVRAGSGNGAAGGPSYFGGTLP